MNSIIFLIGMPGSGKSHWAHIMATHLQWHCYDLDQLIEEKENASISEIFTQHGEAYFRAAETAVLHSFDHKEKCILATGGGTPCFGDNMQWMNAHGTTIWIDEPLDMLAARLQKEKAHRPLLSRIADTELLPFLQQQYIQRSAFYNQATYHLTNEDITLGALLKCL